jgi:hypothetical protein
MSKDKTMKQPRDLQGTLAVCVTFPFLFFLVGMLGAAWCVSKIEFFAQNSWQVINILKASAGLLRLNISNSVGHYQFLYNYFPVPYNYAAHVCVGSGALLAFAGLWLGWWITTPQPAIEHLAGRQLKTGKQAFKALKKEMREEIGREAEGVDLYPGISCSFERETKHICAIGGSGAGKTTVLYPIIKEAVDRGDRVLIYDNKGEWTSYFNGLILAPWDKRCVAWKISADLENVADARSFSESLIKESSDPMWSSAARAILTAVLVYLMSEKENWTLRDVLFEIAKGYKHVRAIVRECTPESAQIVEAEEISKTEKGFLINLSTYLSNVADLAAAWHGKREISIRGWLLTNKQIKNPTNRILLMQGNERYRQLEKAYIQAIMEVVGATVSSPTMTESRTRRIWFAFDEIVQAGKIPTLTKMLEVGRSKGIRMIIGAQDLGQIREEYGNNIAEIWTSNISTYFLGSTGAVETAEFLAKLCGKQKIRKYVASYAGGGMAGSTAEQRQDSWQESEEWIIRPDEFSELGNKKKKKGVEMLLLTGSRNVYKMLWPWVEKKEIRKGEVAAAWTKRRKVKQLTDYGRELKKQSTAGGVEQKQEAPAPAHEPEQQQGQQDKQKPEQKEPKPEPKQEPKPEPKSNSFLPPQPTEASEAEHDAAQQEPEQEQEDVHKEIVSEGLEDLIPGWNEIDEAVKGVEFASSLVSSPKKQATQVVEMSHDEEEEQEC